MDETPDLDQELESWYQYLIGILRWVVEIGRVDIITEVSFMGSQVVMPTVKHGLLYPPNVHHFEGGGTGILPSS